MSYNKDQFAQKLLAMVCGSSAIVLAAGAHVTSAEAAEDVGAIDEIIVTAQKRAESLQSVPVSITAISGDKIADRKIINVKDVAAQVPSMALVSPWGDAIPIFSLRGVSTVDYSQNQSSPVALYVDEVYKGAPVFTSLQMFDLDRVEVLRGPQGTLYGKNTTGGAINIHTKGASLSDGISGYLSGGYGRFNRTELAGAINLPLVDDVLATRIAATMTKVDGFIKNQFPGAADQNSIDDWAVRWSTLWRPAEAFEANLRFTHTEATPTGYAVLADDIGPGGVGFFTGYDREGLGFFDGETDTPGRLDIENTSAALTLNWDLSDNVALTSVSSFDDGKWLTDEDSDGTPISILQADYVTEAEAWSQDLRLASTGDEALEWLVGAYVYTDSIQTDGALRYFYEFASLDGDGVPFCFTDFFTGCVYTNEYKQKRTSLAVYTQNTLHVTEQLAVTLGLRYTDDKNKLKYYRGGFGYLDPVTGEEFLDIAPTITEPPVGSASDSYLDGKLGLEFQADDETLLYVSVSSGHRGTAFNGAAFGSPDEITVANPEKVEAVEVGLKTMLMDNRLRLNGAGFYYRYKDQQFIDFTPEGLQILSNAPKSRIYGMEVEMVARLMQGLDLNLGLSYLNSKFKEIILQGTDLSGNNLIAAPEWTLNGGVDWDVINADAGIVTLALNTRYSSKIYFDAFNSEEGTQPGYWLHDARLSFESNTLPVRVSAWVKNIANKKYSPYRLNTLSFFNYNYVQRGRPREFGIDVKYTF